MKDELFDKYKDCGRLSYNRVYMLIENIWDL